MTRNAYTLPNTAAALGFVSKLLVEWASGPLSAETADPPSELGVFRQSLTAANQCDQFDVVAFLELRLLVASTWHELLVDFHRHRAIVQPKFDD